MPAASRSTHNAVHARDRLLDAATLLFAAHGYHAIGLRDLAGHLGLHAGSLYHHIDNKQGLLFELIESALADLLCGTQRQLRSTRSANERLQVFVQAFVAFSQSDRDRLVLLVRDAVYLSAEQNQQIEHLKTRYSALLAGLIAGELGLAREGNEAQVRQIANAIVSLLFGHSQWLRLEVPDGQLGQVLTRFVRGIVETGRRG